jgi:aspartate/methionine/tyrosine aminotransferase
VARLGTETAFETLARSALEAQGRGIIHLEIGDPDFDTRPM